MSDIKKAETGVIAYEVKTEHFSGPFEKLLELIDKKKLEVTALNLAAVTGDFIAYFKKIEADDSTENMLEKKRFLSDFVVVAARLLFLKSRALLPAMPLEKEEEEDIKILEERLILYKTMKKMAPGIFSFWVGREKSFAREFFKDRPDIFHPDPGWDAKQADIIVKNLLKVREKEAISKETMTQRKIISIGEMVKRIWERLALSEKVVFEESFSGKDREEIVALFLAILHLWRDNSIKIKQDNNFSKIVIGTN